jgi:cytidylate kinase
MADKVVITIARQIGTGGSYLAQRLAKRLNYKYFDREIMVHLSHKLGLDVDYVEARNEKKSSVMQNILRAFAFGAPGVTYLPPDVSLLDDKRMFELQSEVIRDIANKGNVVIVGRGAFYILRNLTNVVSIFIHANREFRIKRIIDIYKVGSVEEANKTIDRVDEERRLYIKNNTGLDWLDANNYKFCFDSSFIGLHTIENIIYEFVKSKFNVN